MDVLDSVALTTSKIHCTAVTSTTYVTPFVKCGLMCLTQFFQLSKKTQNRWKLPIFVFWWKLPPDTSGSLSEEAREALPLLWLKDKKGENRKYFYLFFYLFIQFTWAQGPKIQLMRNKLWQQGKQKPKLTNWANKICIFGKNWSQNDSQ